MVRSATWTTPYRATDGYARGHERTRRTGAPGPVVEVAPGRWDRLVRAWGVLPGVRGLPAGACHGIRRTSRDPGWVALVVDRPQVVALAGRDLTASTCRRPSVWHRLPGAGAPASTGPQPRPHSWSGPGSRATSHVRRRKRSTPGSRARRSAPPTRSDPQRAPGHVPTTPGTRSVEHPTPGTP
jgi:hypothetical protein